MLLPSVIPTRPYPGAFPEQHLNHPPLASSDFLLVTHRRPLPPRPQPLSQPGQERSKPRIDLERKENHRRPGPAEGVSWGSHVGLEVTLDENQHPVPGAWRAGSTVCGTMRYSGVFLPFAPGLSSPRMFSHVLKGPLRASSPSQVAIPSLGLCCLPTVHIPWWKTHSDPLRRGRK